MKHILALDQGTTSSRAIVFNDAGSIEAVAQQEFRQIFPQPGWVEHDANEIWSTQCEVAVEALVRARLKKSDLAAIGIANQRETTVVWDRQSGAPVGNAIVWQDRRTASFCERLKADGLEPLMQARTGLVVDAYFSASNLRWILDKHPGARAKAETVQFELGAIGSSLEWALPVRMKHITDANNAL